MLAMQQAPLRPAMSGRKGWQAAALRRLAGSRFGYRLFQGLGRCYGAEDLGVQGEFGLITGAINDAAVLRAYAVNGFWARAANRFFCDFFAGAGGGTYLDIGANIGLTTILVAQNPRVACKAFEPAPRNFRYLAQNIAANCAHGNVDLFNLALFDRRATMTMGLAPRNSGDARIRPDGAESAGELIARTVTVPAERLDDVLDLERLQRPIAAKIVTQGAEARVLAGGQRVLGEADALVLEFDPALIGEIDQTIDVTTDFLARNFTTAAPLRGPDFETGAQHHPLVWRPMGEMIDEMRTMMRHPSVPGGDYYYIYVRR
jgi:FkbM family methyltransferase